MKQKNASVIFYFSWLFLIAISFAFFSCTHTSSAKKNNVGNQQTEMFASTTVLAKPGVVINSDTCPKPTVITVPTTNNASYKSKSGTKTTIEKMFPPTTIPVNFFTGMKNYNTEDGLALSAVTCSCMDANGRLWFGTNGGGISCYDGQSFKNYTTEQGLPNNTIWSIAGDKKGNVWIGSLGNGLSLYNGKTFRHIIADQGLSGATIVRIFEDKNGNMWFASYNNGVSCYDGKSFKNYTVKQGLLSNQVYSIAQDKKGNMWLGSNAGVSCYDGKKFINYTPKDGLPSSPVYCITEDKKGNIWLGTMGGGISCYDGKSFTNYNTSNGFLSNKIYCVSEDEKGNIWFGTDAGVSCYDGKNFTNYTTSQGLANNTVYSITKGKNGELWFGTLGGGISRYDGGAFRNLIATNSSLNTAVADIAQDDKGNLWFGTNEGALCYDGNKIIKFTTKQGLSANAVWSFASDKKGNFWIGTDGGGVSFYNGKTFTNYTKDQGLLENYVFCIRIDKKGNVWFGTNAGVSCFDGKNFTNYTYAQGLPGSAVWSILPDKNGNIWFGTDGGLSRYNGKTFTNFVTANGNSRNTVKCIAEDSCGNIWFGTEGGGIGRYDGKNILNFTQEDGLANDDVNQIIIDKHQNVVVGTLLGFSILQFKNAQGKLIGAGNFNLSNQELKKHVPFWDIYNFKTGYPAKDIGAMMMDKNGIIWAGSADKIVRFDYAAIHKNNAAPKVFLQSLKINDETVCWNDLIANNNEKDSSVTPPNLPEEAIDFGKILSDALRDTMRQKFGDIKFDSISRFYPVPENMILPYHHNNITFNFAAIEPVRPFLVRYQYKLKGFDDSWSPVTEETNATFDNIYEGNYTFELKAESPDGVWSNPIMYHFKILPPLWRTWWMYIIYVFSFLILIVGFIKWRERNLKKEKLILEQTVSLRTKEVVKQKELVEEKNKEIIDSINYALRLQQAILPTFDQLYDCFPQSFVLFKPKDIVSGDFYFLSKKNNCFFIAAADSTGHGVPGAFMSMLGHEKLTDAIEKSTHTSEILSLLNKGIKQSLHQTAHETSTRDGMDIAFCAFDFQNKKVEFAGANRPLWIIRKGEKEVEEIKATKKAIGGLTEDNQLFETHTINCDKGDSFYIFTDGYVDQFGGKKNKKLMAKTLKSLLLEIQDKSMEEQGNYLADFIQKWKGDAAQIDDILVIGIRV